MEKEKYEIVLEAIEAGGATEESLMELIGTKSIRGVNNQFKFINVLKKFPVKGDDGVYVILGAEEYGAFQKKAETAKDAEKKWTDNPQAKRQTFESRLTTKISRMNAAKKRMNDNPDDQIIKLKNTIAACEFHVANIQLNDFQTAMCAELSLDLNAYKECEDLNALQKSMQETEAG